MMTHEVVLIFFADVKSIANPDPNLELTCDLPAPVLYWQPTQLSSYFHVHLDLVMTQQDLNLLPLFLWILFSD